jgi:hypothetical protein
LVDPSSTQSGPPFDRIPLPELLRHAIEYFGAARRAAEALKEKVMGREIRAWVRWYSGSDSQWLLYGKPGDFLGEEPATPELLEGLCQGMGFWRLFDDDGISAGGGKTAFVEASRRDAAKFWPFPEGRQHMQGRRDTRGAKTDYDWESALIAAAVRVWVDGLPETQAALEEYIADWFGENGPDTTQIRTHIGPLFRALKQA